jgi:hypothetical protein
MLVIALVACESGTAARDSPTRTLERAHGQTDVVIRVGDYRDDNIDVFVHGPTFTLYGDGTLIVGAGLAYTSGTLTTAEVDGLLATADKAGLLDQPFTRTNPEPQPVDGVETYSLELNADGRRVVQEVIGPLDFPEAQAIARFNQLLHDLATREATRSWSPERYVAVELRPGVQCRVVVTSEPDPSAPYYAWALFPDVDPAVAVRRLSERCS